MVSGCKECEEMLIVVVELLLEHAILRPRLYMQKRAEGYFIRFRFHPKGAELSGQVLSES
jgi:hypothetical protein